MLKAFRELALTGPRLPEPEVVRAGVMAAGRFLGLAGVAFLLGRAVLAAVGPMCALAPFAIALFAAGLTAGLNPAPLLAGCVLGAVGPGLRAFNLALPLGCAVVLAGSLIQSAVGPRIKRLWGPKLRARSPATSRSFRRSISPANTSRRWTIWRRSATTSWRLRMRWRIPSASMIRSECISRR